MPQGLMGWLGGGSKGPFTPQVPNDIYNMMDPSQAATMKQMGSMFPAIGPFQNPIVPDTVRDIAGSQAGGTFGEYPTLEQQGKGAGPVVKTTSDPSVYADSGDWGANMGFARPGSILGHIGMDADRKRVFTAWQQYQLANPNMAPQEQLLKFANTKAGRLAFERGFLDEIVRVSIAGTKPTVPGVTHNPGDYYTPPYNFGDKPPETIHYPAQNPAVTMGSERGGYVHIPTYPEGQKPEPDYIVPGVPTEAAQKNNEIAAQISQSDNPTLAMVAKAGAFDDKDRQAAYLDKLLKGGKITQDQHDMFAAGALQVKQATDQYGQPVGGWQVINVLTGEVWQNGKAMGAPPAALPAQGGEAAPLPQQGLHPWQEGGQPSQVPPAMEPKPPLDLSGPAGPDPYGLIPKVDSRGEDQIAKFREWNPDPVGNSDRLLGQVNPAFQKIVARAHQLYQGDFVVGSGLRSLEMQDKAVKNGWSPADAQATHTDGRSIDLWPVKNGQVYFDKIEQLKIARAMSQAAKELGVPMVIGARFRTPDLPHFQLPAGYGNWSPNTPAGEMGPRAGTGTPIVTNGQVGWWSPDKQSYAVQYLMKNAKLSEWGAKGLVARWMYVESPNGPGSVNPKSGAEGIGQWLGSRQTGYKLGDFDSELAKAASELNGEESLAAKALRAANDPESAAVGAAMFERAEGYRPGSGRDNFVDKTIAGLTGKAAYSSYVGQAAGGEGKVSIPVAGQTNLPVRTGGKGQPVTPNLAVDLGAQPQAQVARSGGGTVTPVSPTLPPLSPEEPQAVGGGGEAKPDIASMDADGNIVVKGLGGPEGQGLDMYSATGWLNTAIHAGSQAVSPLIPEWADRRLTAKLEQLSDLQRQLNSLNDGTPRLKALAKPMQDMYSNLKNHSYMGSVAAGVAMYNIVHRELKSAQSVYGDASQSREARKAAQQDITTLSMLEKTLTGGNPANLMALYNGLANGSVKQDDLGQLIGVDLPLTLDKVGEVLDRAWSGKPPGTSLEDDKAAAAKSGIGKRSGSEQFDIKSKEPPADFLGEKNVDPAIRKRAWEIYVESQRSGE